MKCFKYRPTLFILILGLMFSSAVGSEEGPKKASAEVDTGPIVITSQTLEFDNKRKVVVFTGNVVAKREDFTINCQKMLLYYLDSQTGRVEGKEELKIDRIIATGQVKISRPDGGLAKAEKAIYYENDEKVILTGNPGVRQGTDFVEGSRITLFLKEKRSIVEGSESKKVKAVLFPRNKKR